MLLYHLGFPLCNFPQCQNSIDVNFVWEIGSSVAKAGQKFHDCLQAAWMSSITQNFDSKSQLIIVALFKGPNYEIMNRL